MNDNIMKQNISQNEHKHSYYQSSESDNEECLKPESAQQLNLMRQDSLSKQFTTNEANNISSGGIQRTLS